MGRFLVQQARPIADFKRVLAALVMAVCAAAVAQPSSTQLVVGSIQEPGTLLPYGDTLVVGMDIQNLVYDGLLNLDDTGQLIPRLAVEVPTVENGGISSDGKQVTFVLRDNLFWHDGTRLTSADVLFTWELLTDPSTPLVERSAWEGISEVRTPDATTVEFIFEAPRPGFPGLHAQAPSFILPKHLLEGEDIGTSALHERPVGSGPFRVAEWVRGSHVLLTRNDSYWLEGKPLLEEILFRFIPSTEGLRAELDLGAIHLRQAMSATDVRHAESLAEYRVVASPSYSTWIFTLNHRRGPLQDKTVREALELALDKATIAATVLGGTVQPQYAAIPSSHWAHASTISGRGFDLEQSTQRLEEAGWLVGPDGVRTKDGQRLELELLNIAGDQERLRIVQLAQAMWAEAGFDVSITLADAATFGPSLFGGEFDIAFHFWTDQHQYDFGYFNLDLSGWEAFQGAEAQALVRAALSEPDLDDRLAALHEFQELVADELPVIPLAMRMIFDAVSDDLIGYSPNPLVGRAGNFWNASDWQLR